MTDNKSSGWVRPFGIHDFLVLAGILTIYSAHLSGFADDPGTGWHLKTGELIAAQRAVPSIDPFLASISPKAWVCDQWIGDVLLYGLVHMGGWPLLYAVVPLLYSYFFLIALYRFISQETDAPIASSFAALLAFKLGELHLLARPVVLAFPIFILIYVIASRLYKSLADGSCSLRGRWWLPILFCVWANLHGSFVLGLILLGLAVIAGIFDCRISSGKWPLALLVRAGFLLSLCVAATLLNPYGFGLYASMQALANNQFFMGFHMEWLSPDFKSASGIFLQIVFLILIVGIWCRGKAASRISTFEILSILVIGHFALEMIRMVPFFGIVTSVPIARCLVSIGGAIAVSKIRLAEPLSKAWLKLEKRERQTYRGAPVLAVLLIGILLSALCYGRIPFFAGEFGPSPEKYPYEALRVLNADSSSAKRLVVLNDPGWGGFITYFGDGRIVPVLDDRNLVVGESEYREYFSQLRPSASWREYLSSRGVNLLMLEPDHAFSQYLLETGVLSVVYKDQVAVLFQVS